MEEIIKLIVQQEGAVAILRNKTIHERLIIRSITFFDRNNRYKSLFLMHNMSEVYLPSGKYLPIDGTDSFLKKIKANIKVYETRKEYLEDTFSLDENMVQRLFENLEDNIMNHCYANNITGYKVYTVSVHWFPVSSVIVHYSYNRTLQKPLTILRDNVNCVEDIGTPNFEEFVKVLYENLGKYIILRKE